jgi:hypothetical protein
VNSVKVDEKEEEVETEPTEEEEGGIRLPLKRTARTEIFCSSAKI